MQVHKLKLSERLENLFDVCLREIEVKRAHVQLHSAAGAARAGPNKKCSKELSLLHSRCEKDTEHTTYGSLVDGCLFLSASVSCTLIGKPMTIVPVRSIAFCTSSIDANST